MLGDENKFGYKKLIVWQKSDELAFEIYKITKQFPADEIYGIVSQLRRAALSIPVNIAEGYGRQGRKELRRLNYLAKDDYNELQNLAEENGRILWKFYKNL